MTEFTTNNLVTFLANSPTDPSSLTLKYRITTSEYDSCVQVVQTRIDKLLQILHTNHWDIISSLFSTKMSRSTAPHIKYLSMIFSNNDRRSDLIYKYLIELYVLVRHRATLENSVENTIEYNEPNYTD